MSMNREDALVDSLNMDAAILQEKGEMFFLRKERLGIKRLTGCSNEEADKQAQKRLKVVRDFMNRSN